jgi:hypothetical protein
VTDPNIERYFAILGLQPQATEQEVKEARNFVTQAFHPDKYPPGSKDQERANLKQIEINEAYQKINEHFERLKRDQAQMQARVAPGHGPDQVNSRSGAGSRKTPIIVTLAKVLLVGVLAGAWTWAVWGWVGSMHRPVSQSAPLPEIAAPIAASQPVPDSASQNSLSQSQPKSPVNVEKQSDVTQLPDVQILDLLLFLSLVLSTLAVIWFLFAPESQALIERLVGTQK